MSVLNGERVQKIDTEIIVENNQVFEYNGGGQSPKVYPDYLSYTYAFKKKGDDIVFEEAPSEIGEYEVVITLPESKFRKKSFRRPLCYHTMTEEKKGDYFINFFPLLFAFLSAFFCLSLQHFR